MHVAILYLVQLNARTDFQLNSLLSKPSDVVSTMDRRKEVTIKAIGLTTRAVAAHTESFHSE